MNIKGTIDMSNLAIIPARSGSKGIKDKNIREIYGKPLIAYTIENALQSQYIDELMVSTDSKEYADIAKRYGAKVPFLRSKRNSSDVAQTIDVVLEVLSEYEKSKISFDNVIILQPTSPLRTSKNIDNAFKLFYSRYADSVVSVCKCEHSPVWSNILPEDANLYGFISEENLKRRQKIKDYYRLNGAIYISKVQVLKKNRSFYGKKSYACIMEQAESVDIDTDLDFLYAEFLIGKQQCMDLKRI